jgi:hypothetical protein
MSDTKSRLVSGYSACRVATILAAGFMILLGIVFQLAQLGYDGIAVNNFWFVTTIAGNLWNFLVVRSDVPALGELLRFWPMLIVAAGLALLAAPYPNLCAAKLSASQERIANRE